jgi:hypothetical protein
MLNSRHSINNMKNLLVALIFGISFSSLAQLPKTPLKQLKSFEVSDTIVFAAVDRPGDVYIITRDGQIQKFDKDGRLIVLYKNKVLPTLFDPRDGARLFTYYRQNQEYDYLSPSFEIVSSYRIDSAFVIEPWLIGPGSEQRLWILDAADHSLKKINTRDSEVEVEVVIDSTIISDATTFTYLREYQGFVFLLDPKRGIFVFNGMGKHIRTIEEKGITAFNFLGEELYFAKAGIVKFFDLFTAETRSIAFEKPFDFVLITDERLIQIRKKGIEIFEFHP